MTTAFDRHLQSVIARLNDRLKGISEDDLFKQQTEILMVGGVVVPHFHTEGRIARTI